MADDEHDGGKRQRVLVVGGGVAGIEAALALNDLAGELLDVDIYDPRHEFVFKPFAVGEPYGASRAFRRGLVDLSERSGATFHPCGIVSVDPEGRTAVTRDGERLSYDFLILATGVRMLWAVPGATTFWGAADEGQVGDVIAELRAGALDRLVFTMPGGHSWALPLYELALLAMTELEKAGAGRTRITVLTPEDAPLEVFGRTVAERMGELLEERGVELISGTHPVKFEHGMLQVAPGDAIPADTVISLPRLEGRRVGGVPHDGDGFVPVDESCRVSGLDRVYAAGDVTAFPVKQGGIATQQADSVAEAIAAAAGADVEPRAFDPVLRGILWTGERPRYLYGRPTGGHGEAAGFSDRPQGPLRSGKVTARYFTPLVDAIAAEVGQAANGGGPATAARASSAG
jgi:sulfide:quinone oxidoreductase